MDKIVILSEHFGCGHTKAAENLAKGIKELDLEISTIVSEPGLERHPKVFKKATTLYNTLLKISPSLWGYTYENQRNKDLQKIYTALFRLQTKFKNSYLESLTQIVGESKTVICTHPIPLQGMGFLKRMGWSGKLAAFITDYDFHGAWFHPAVDKYFFSGEDNLGDLLIDLENKVISTPIPVDIRFWNPIEKNKAKHNLNLHHKEKVILVMGGGWGLGIDNKLFKQLINLPKENEIIIITGINKKLHNYLSNAVLELGLDNIQIMGFVNNIQEFMCASDILITKPGALTCSEALSLGLPIILIKPIPGQEEKNCSYLLQKYENVRYLDDYSKLNSYIDEIKGMSYLKFDPTIATREIIKFHLGN